MQMGRVAGLAALSAMIVAGSALAQEKKAGEPATGTGWAAQVKGGTTEIVLDPKQTEAVKKVSAYFNALDNMRGVFNQTDPDKTKSRGRFYMKKPGKFRFDYGAPSKKTMLSDGTYLRIQEPDMQNPDTYQLDNTPFRVLLKKDVDLIRDARILDVQESEDLLVIALMDKSPDAPGRMQLYFTKKQGLELKEWVVMDPQGLETRVEVSDLNRTEEIDPKLFVWQSNVFGKQ